MYISVNWLKDFVNLDGLNIEDVVQQFTLSCAEVEGVEYKGKDVQGVITARIEKVVDHPNSKKLHLLEVNTGKEKLAVVCGAPNVKVGMITAFAPIGAQVGQLTIGKAIVGGYESYGMCCSAKELGISDDHSGILEFSADQQIGVDVKKVLPIDDIIIEIDNKSLTNRPDMWGHYGIAREIAAITGRTLQPYIVDQHTYSGKENLAIEVLSPSCYRYSAVRIGHVTKHSSPEQLKIRLYYCGMRAISLLADLTNYIMLELGQPMHSFDGSKIQSITVRDIQQNTPFTTLDGVQRILPSGTMVIDTNHEIGAIAGVMGGQSTEIEENTDSVFLEVANFEAVKVRKTATAIGLRSESSARYEKSLDPEMTMRALRRYIYLLQTIDPNCKVVSNICDVCVKKYDKIVINITKQFIDKYTGVDIPQERMVHILTSLGFQVTENGSELCVHVPSWRATKDISNKADIVEEITRVYGYDNIVSKPSTQPIKPLRIGTDIVREYDIKYMLAQRYNWHEIHSYIWEDQPTNAMLGIETPSYIYLINSLQKDNDNIRSSMKPTMIRTLLQNKRYADDFGVFEIGHVVTGMKDHLAQEEKHLGIGVMTKQNNFAQKLLEVKDSILYLFHYVLQLPVRLEESRPIEEYLCPINHYDIICDHESIGNIGVLHPKVQQKIDAEKVVILVELNVSKMYQKPAEISKYESVSKYPTTSLDFNFVLDQEKHYGDIEEIAHKIPTTLSYHVELLDIFDNGNTKNYTLRYFVTSKEHTLSSEEIEQFHTSVITTFEEHGVYLKTE